MNKPKGVTPKPDMMNFWDIEREFGLPAAKLLKKHPDFPKHPRRMVHKVTRVWVEEQLGDDAEKRLARTGPNFSAILDDPAIRKVVLGGVLERLQEEMNALWLSFKK